MQKRNYDVFFTISISIKYILLKAKQYIFLTQIWFGNAIDNYLRLKIRVVCEGLENF